MSIPPLVCSTPPPPDQCEDDNDNEDFDIAYNLSQDDDDDSYDCGNFSSYNHTTITPEIKKDNGLSNIETLNINDSKETLRNEIKQENYHDNEHSQIGTTINKIKSEEDTNVEDLDLKLSDEPVFIKQENVSDYSSESPINIVDEIERSPNSAPSPCDDGLEDNLSSNNEKNVVLNDDIISDVPTFPEVISDCSNIPTFIEDPSDLCTDTLPDSESKQDKEMLNDDFGDFEDFQFVNSDEKPPVLENYDNPWVNNDVDSNDFGKFTANFDTVEVQETKIDEVNKISETQNIELGNTTILDQLTSPDDDDDFGDFDDFKSSAADNLVPEENKESLTSQVPVLNFQMSDNEMQVVESINKVLSSIFNEEFTETEHDFEGKLESMLSVTWGHLRETDVRQPYILNWNNSLGQKTLLKALCIDSRNILFGPKWGYNPPKFAANLSVAPLQPQKPLTPSNGSQETDKVASKAANWSDPFTSDGQESCNKENEGASEVRPSDLDMFEASISSKPDKIYSSTLNVQPLRQISLPDTHIFTPTDSETPRSKTIHYDSGPPILLPQPVLESNKNIELTGNQHTEPPNEKEGDGYWEFQDFKSGSQSAPPSTSQQKEQPEPKSDSMVLKPNVTYQTQVLLPVKMEPIMPTLNWPDPGEVKETFEDFSDFISNSSWADDKFNTKVPTSSVESSVIVGSNHISKINDTLNNLEIQHKGSNPSAQDVDDEFDTFQSALPPKNQATDSNFDSINSFNNIPNVNSIQPLTQIANFDYAFPKPNSVKSDVISVENTIPYNKALTQSNMSTSMDLASSKSSLPLGNQVPINLLQPMQVNTTPTQTQQKSGQILQPLSLESYSQINWPNPEIDLQDLSRFNPVETLQSLKTDLSASGPSKTASPVHSQKPLNNQADDDIWGDFVSSKPKQQKKTPVFADDDEWTDFVSSPSVKPLNGLNTISLNVHTNSSIQKPGNKFSSKSNQLPLDIPSLNYITPKTSGHNSYNNRHFENL